MTIIKALFNMIFWISIIGTTVIAENQNTLTGPYLGQKPPGKTPELFAPGLISTDGSEGCSGWGNNMEFFIFQRFINRKPKLFIMDNINGEWSEPKPLSMLDKYLIGDFTLAPDGKTIIFATKNKNLGPEGEGCNIGTIEKTEDGWTVPKMMGFSINTQFHDSYPSLAGNNNLYFFSRKPGGYGKSDIFLSRFSEGQYQPPENLGNRLNTEHHEWDTYIAPDESYMIYCSTKPSGLGDDDLYVTYKNEDGTWTEPIHMGDAINSVKAENRPYVSPDGKYFFYTSTIRGNRDIYWVDAKIIEDLRP